MTKRRVKKARSFKTGIRTPKTPVHQEYKRKAPKKT